MMKAFAPVLHAHRSRWWLGLYLAPFVAVLPLQAQIYPGPAVNLFGDELVKKLRVEQGMIIFPAEGFDAKQSEAALEGYGHVLVLHDGTQLRGEIVSVTKDEVFWKRPDILEPLRFRYENVRRVLIFPPTEPSPRRVFIPAEEPDGVDPLRPGFATVKLSGGDWLHGDLSTTDGQTFSFKLDAQTSFTLSREAISWIYSGGRPAPAYGFNGGVLDMEEWLSRTGAQAEVKNGTLTIKGAEWIGRPVLGLRRFEMNFELPEDAEDNTRIWLQPYGPGVNTYSTGTIEMRLGHRQLRHTIFANGINNVDTPIPKADAEESGPVRYRVLYDGPGERLIVIRNGRKLGEWKFRDDNNKGQMMPPRQNYQVTGICFQKQRANGTPLKLNRLRVQPWDGRLSNESAVTGEGPSILSTDDKLRAGQLEALSHEELVFSGEKLERKSKLFLQFANEPAPLANAAALLLFGDRGELSVTELDVSDGKAKFRTGFAPALESPLAALQTIVFPNRPEIKRSRTSDTLIFKNGDEISGFLVSAEEGKAWRWQTMEGQEINIQPKYIAGFRSLAGRIAPAIPTDAATVELRNGDRLRGDLTGFSDGKIQFHHAQLGNFSLEQKHLWNLFPNPDLLVMEGGQNPEKWMGITEDGADLPQPIVSNSKSKADPDRWIYLDGNYVLRADPSNISSYSPNALITSLKTVPDRFELRFDVTDVAGKEPNIVLYLTTQRDNGRLQAQIAHGQLYAHMFSRKTRGSRSRQMPLAGKISEPTSRRNIRVFVDAKVGTADIFLDGVFLTKLGQQEAERIPGLGETIRLQPFTQNSPQTLSNIWIGPWNGELPKAGDEPVPMTSLTNGDVAEGSPTDFRNGKVVLQSEIGELEVPMEKVLAVEFGGAMSPKVAAARVRLSDGCVISADTFHWEGNELIIQSELLGKINIPARMVTELALDPAPPRAPKNPPAKNVATREGADER